MTLEGNEEDSKFLDERWEKVERLCICPCFRNDFPPWGDPRNSIFAKGVFLKKLADVFLSFFFRLLCIELMHLKLLKNLAVPYDGYS